MKPTESPGAIRRHFVEFASAFQELSPEGRRSLMVAGVITAISLGVIGTASFYTYRSPQPIEETVLAGDRDVSDYTVPPLAPSAAAPAAAPIRAAAPLPAAPAPARILPFGHGQAANVVAAAPAASQAPVATTSREPSQGMAIAVLPEAGGPPVIVPVAQAPQAQPAPVQPAALTASPPPPELMPRRRRRRHMQQHQLAQWQIDAYLRRNFPGNRQGRRRYRSEAAPPGIIPAVAMDQNQPAGTAPARRRRQAAAPGGVADAGTASAQPPADAALRSYLARQRATNPQGRLDVADEVPATRQAVPVAYQAPATAARAPGNHYAIQIGYYTNRAFARIYAGQLARQGLRPYMISTRKNGPVRLLVGRFDNVTDAQSSFKKMPAAVGEGMIVRTDW